MTVARSGSFLAEIPDGEIGSVHVKASFGDPYSATLSALD